MEETIQTVAAMMIGPLCMLMALHIQKYRIAKAILREKIAEEIATRKAILIREMLRPNMPSWLPATHMMLEGATPYDSDMNRADWPYDGIVYFMDASITSTQQWNSLSMDDKVVLAKQHGGLNHLI